MMRGCGGHEVRRSSWLLTLGLIASGGLGLTAQAPADRGSFTWDSRFLTNRYSSLSIGQFGIDLIDLAALPGDVLRPPLNPQESGEPGFLFWDAGEFRNLQSGLLMFFGSTFVSAGYQLAYHEFGHGTRLAAVGFRPYYGHGRLRTAGDIEAAGRSQDLSDSFFKYFLTSLTNQRGYTLAFDDRTLFPILTDEVDEGWEGSMLMGGINHEMFFTEMIEDRIHRGGGHVGYLSSYFNGKLAADHYGIGPGVANDVGRLLTYYESLGFGISHADITTGSKQSLLLSSTTYLLAFQFSRMLMGQEARFRDWAPGGIELPTTSFFMNRDGLSYRVRVGYRRGGWRFPVAVERLYKGRTRTEASVGLEHSDERMEAGAEVTLGKQLGLSVRVAYELRGRVSLTGGYALYDRRNLRGERLIPSLEHGPRYQNLFVGLRLAY